MRALVTGGAGFIGSHLCDELVGRGVEVVVLDNLATGEERNIAHLMDRPPFEFVKGSVLDSPLVDQVIARVDVVYHLAAAVGVRLIVEKPLESLITNIRGSEIVLERAFQHGRKVLVASTSEIYGKSMDVPLKEDGDRLLGSPLVGRWSYSTSKAVDEILAHAYCVSKGLPTVIARLFNTTGPRQSPRYGMVLPRFIEAALAGADLEVHGDGSQTRCFAYVGDVVPALIDLMECAEAEGEAVNIGSQEEVTMLELAQRVVAVTGSDSSIRLIPYEEAYERDFEDMPRRVPSLEKAARLIGYKPSTDLDDIIRRMAQSIQSR